MNAKRAINWVTPSGTKVELKIEMTKDVRDKISYSDGWNINLGPETVDRLLIEVFADEKFITRSFNPPHKITKFDYSKRYDELVSKGIYARVGDAFVNEERYNIIINTIAEMESELNASLGEQYILVKASEIEKAKAEEQQAIAEAEEYEALVESGLCPKCGTWCYGDCEANS